MVVLFFGDIFGRPGREAILKALPNLKKKYQPDFILGNVENLAGGKGVTEKTLLELRGAGFHAFTSGNHIWDNREVFGLFEMGFPLIRPANYPDRPSLQCPGPGQLVVESGPHRLMLVNLMGRLFMDPLDCPFREVDEILKTNTERIPVWVDMHAEATSEKYAMGWYLDGRVAAVVGTHTHVQTSDARLLKRGTAYITDVGMNGSFDSVIGMGIEESKKRFSLKRRQPYVVATENAGISAVVVKIDDKGQATSIESLRYSVTA